MAANTPEFSPDELDELLSGVLPDIPGYRVLRLLGRGGMSYVYLGVEESLDRQVAIKVIKPVALQDEVSMQRFEKEARTIAKLQHPCIVGIHAVGRMELGLLYYVMPYLSRGHVGQRDLRNDEAQIIEVLRALLSALDYAHGHGIVHRDVKAENVLFDHTDRPLLTDFGIAISKRDRSRMTGGGKAMGSWGYMAPEQARGEDVDGRADLYALGVLTYEMLCGALPYRNRDTVALALMHAMDPVPQLPADKAHWQGFIDKAMAKAPAQRFASAQDMLDALDQMAIKQGQAATPPPRAWTFPTALGTAASRFGLVALALLALLVAAIATAFWSGKEQAREEIAEIQTSAPLVEAPTQPATDDPLPADANNHSVVAEEASTDQPPAAPANEDESPTAIEEEPVEQPALPPGELALNNASEQITRRRLTQPPGGNALESLLTAQRLQPRSAQLPVLGNRWLGAALPYLANALQAGDDDTAKSLHDSGRQLAEQLALADGEAWREFSAAMTGTLRKQLQDALQRRDVNALQNARQRAQRLGIPGAQLEPEYSRTIVLAKPGDPLKHGGTTMILVRMPSDKNAGLATMPTAVTRSTYDAFASATKRPPGSCRNRMALLSLKKRSWNDPGFSQSGDHPAVCVSVADAEAFASWLGQRDGVKYRLPSKAEWQVLAGAPATATCGAGGIVCSSEGTTPAARSPSFRNGISSMLGNAREWPSDCAGCRDHPTVGLGWRDGSSSRENNNVDPNYGYDDVGFRLVRDLSHEELEQH